MHATFTSYEVATHLRVSGRLSSSTSGYMTFDSDESASAEVSHEARSLRRADPGDASFRRKRSPASLTRNCRRTVTCRRRQTDTLSVASGSLRSRESTSSQVSPYGDSRRESTAGGGREHVRTTAMLVAVVLCFVVVELPQGLLAFLVMITSSIVVAAMYCNICRNLEGTILFRFSAFPSRPKRGAHLPILRSILILAKSSVLASSGFSGKKEVKTNIRELLDSCKVGAGLLAFRAIKYFIFFIRSKMLFGAFFKSRERWRLVLAESSGVPQRD